MISVFLFASNASANSDRTLLASSTSRNSALSPSNFKSFEFKTVFFTTTFFLSFLAFTLISSFSVSITETKGKSLYGLSVAGILLNSTDFAPLPFKTACHMLCNLLFWYSDKGFWGFALCPIKYHLTSMPDKFGNAFSFLRAFTTSSGSTSKRPVLKSKYPVVWIPVSIMHKSFLPSACLKISAEYLMLFNVSTSSLSGPASRRIYFNSLV